MATQTVQINFLANATQAQTAMLQIGRSLKNVQTSAGGANTTLGSMSTPLMRVAKAGAAVAGAYVAIAAAARLAGEAVKVNREYELSMAKVKAVVQTAPGYTAAAYGKMEEEVRRLGATTVFSAGQAAEGLKKLAQSGFTASQATKALGATLSLAQTGELDLADSARIVSDSLRAFKGHASEATRYADVLAFTTSRTSTDVSQLGEAFKYVGPIAGGMGQSIEGIASAMGVLANSGVKASMAGTALRGMMIQLTDTNSKAHTSLLRMGLTAGDIVPSKMNSLADIMAKLESVGVDATNAYSLFGQRAGVAANVLATSAGQLRDLTTATEEAKGSAQQMAAIMDDTFHGSVLRMKSAWEELLIVLGETGVMSGLRGLVDVTSGAVTQLTNAVHIMKNALADGELGTVLLTSLKYAGMMAANEIYSALSLTFKLAGARLVGSFAMIKDPSWWEGLFSIFSAIGGVLLGAAMNLFAVILEDGETLIASLVGGVMLVGQKLLGGLLVAAGSFGAKMADITSALVSKFKDLAGMLGINIESDSEESSMRKSSDDMIARGGKLWDSKFSDNVESARGGVQIAAGALREGATSNLQMAKDAWENSDVLGTLKNNLVKPLTDVWDNHSAGVIFDTTAIEGELSGLFGKYGKKKLGGLDDEDGLLPGGGDGESEGDESGGRGRTAMSGTFRTAINAIMGRTANEEIAMTVKQQRDIMASVLKQSEETNKHLQEMNERGKRKTYSTFD